MTKEEIFDQLKEMLVEQLGVDEADITMKASFQDDLDADSLDLVEVIMEMEDKFSVKISDEEAEKIRTVGEAVDFVAERV
ncbi:MAG: acyl carrier protein [Thermoleophilia bacterium]|jgi:acyl carrier protein|nr:acyl carrier protein [Actinomycetota bacterium]MCL6093040.1 acyl carrier protein [Actinomycetota bacterium]MDA8167369.1 acyl carrier protein [Actinomycetota bacterium]